MTELEHGLACDIVRFLLCRYLLCTLMSMDLGTPRLHTLYRSFFLVLLLL